MTSFDPLRRGELSRPQSSDTTGHLDNDPARQPHWPDRTQVPRFSSAATNPVMMGRYEIVEELGAGQMGTVYRGRDKVLERDVAIKVPRLENSEIQTLMIRRFYREARAVARLNHPSICPIYDVGEVDGKVFIAMGFIKGTTLDRVVGNGKFLRPRAAARLIQRACIAMQHAHDNQVVHRDLKSSNMMINSDGQPVLLDFGLAMLRDDKDGGISHDGQVLGSPAYMSPEQVNGLSVDHRTDIFSMGVVFYEALTGIRPFKGTFTQVLVGIARGLCEAPHLVDSKVPLELSELCQRMMATSPDVRFQTMREAAEALAKYLTATTPEVDEKGSNQDSDRRSQNRIGSVVVEESFHRFRNSRKDPPSRSESHPKKVHRTDNRRQDLPSEGYALNETQAAMDPSVNSLWRRATEAVRPDAADVAAARQRHWSRGLTPQARWWIASTIVAVTSCVALLILVEKSSSRSRASLAPTNVAPSEVERSSRGVSNASFSLDDLDAPP